MESTAVWLWGSSWEGWVLKPPPPPHHLYLRSQASVKTGPGYRISPGRISAWYGRIAGHLIGLDLRKLEEEILGLVLRRLQANPKGSIWEGIF